MILIKNLNKYYKSKKHKKFHALKNINLTLPDAGLVFVLGKSGSGKSTMLNLIGGLDSISSGSIEVDGNDLAHFKEKEFCNYRNNHIGFIFQDYHLIDELTVYENIVLSLDLHRKKDYHLVRAALEKVDLAGYEDRYPTELSGGEQQRVAIARAIVKNPRVILADEPTGNLDFATSKAIIELLRELSKDCLILIVSHNVLDATNYADRIIELGNGEIIKDRTRNPHFSENVTLYNGVLFYPENSILSNKDISIINHHCNKPAMLMRRTDKFLPTKHVEQHPRKIEIKNRSLEFKKEIGLSGKFLKNKTAAIALSSFMVAVIMVIMALAQTITAFNSGSVIVNEMKESNLNSMIIIKQLDELTSAQLDTKYRVSIDESNADIFKETGYEGEIYPIVNYSLPITASYNFMGKESRFISSNIFITETLGTMMVNEDFLTEKFGDYSYAAKRESFHPLGVIITDYVADAILALNKEYKGKDYAYIVNNGLSTSRWPSQVFIVNGIINTDYTERHKSLFDRIAGGSLKVGTSFFSDDEAGDFLDDVYDRLGICYTLNESFLEEYKSTQDSYYTNYHKLVFGDVLSYSAAAANLVVLADNGSKNLTSSATSWRYTTTAPEIPEGAVYMRVCHYPSMEKGYQEEDAAYIKGYATLRFEGQDEISEDRMNHKEGKSLSNNGINEIDASGRYISDYIRIPNDATIAEFACSAVRSAPYCVFYNENKEIISVVHANDYVVERENTMVMSYTVYNEIFGTEYTPNTLDAFVPHEVKLSHFMRYDVGNENPLFEETVYISALSSSAIYASEDLYNKFYQDSIFIYGFYFNGTEGLDKVIDLAISENYSHQSSVIEGIQSMTRAIDVFIPIFELISIFLYIGVIFILVNFSTKMITDKMHDIGILKALGTKNRTIATIFGIQVGLIVLLTCAMSTVGYYLFVDVANDVLINSIRTIAPTWIVLDLQCLVYDPMIAFLNCLLIIGLAGASLIFPMIKIKAIKPVKIIKAKE